MVIKLRKKISRRLKQRKSLKAFFAKYNRTHSHTLKPKRVKSSNVKAVGYDSAMKVLHVDFKSGNSYRYKDVPEKIHKKFISASSKGKFFSKKIRGQYDYDKVN